MHRLHHVKSPAKDRGSWRDLFKEVEFYFVGIPVAVLLLVSPFYAAFDYARTGRYGTAAAILVTAIIWLAAIVRDLFRRRWSAASTIAVALWFLVSAILSWKYF
jgi:hypothetical protein